MSWYPKMNFRKKNFMHTELIGYNMSNWMKDYIFPKQILKYRPTK